ncbi:Hypothetical protein CINCED_3A018613 [Cinara cedri]|uniref:Uncharacterized protein n=1 Tax=Cinara cedri TaxID=506608 RepID=A0A5E4NQI6_9HEMI|nr:Hypothetical protein CINCED_3A018613 [Cinara cedri]
MAAVTPVWDFGGTWSSELAGVRFNMDSSITVGVDNNIPVKILQDGKRLIGFLNNKDWMAKANAQYGRYGPVTLFAINPLEKNVAVFVGFAHSQNNKDFVTGVWTMGRNCKSNLDIHQSVFNIPDVLCRDST